MFPRYERCIALLICSDIDVNHSNKKGYTALHEAVYYGGREAVLAMLKHGSHILDLDSSHGVGRSARDIITEHYPDLKSILPSPRIEQIHSHPHMQLLTAFQHKQLNLFCDLLRQVNVYGNACLNPNFWYSKPYNSTCLEMACKETCCEEFVLALLLAGADVNTVNIITRKSPLHLTAEAGNYEAMKIILTDRRTNVNMVDDSGQTALHIVVEQYRENDGDARRLLECISVLLKHKGTDVNRTDKNGCTAFHLAALRNNTKVVQLILEHDDLELDLDTSQGPGQKTTRDIITENFSEIKRLLPQKSVVGNHECSLKETLFQHLYRWESQEFVSIFKRNLNKYPTHAVQELNDGCYTCLQYASNYGLHDVVKVLLEYEADPNATTDYDKRPPVVLACLRQNQDILKIFLDLPPESNFNINATDAKGNTALHYAAQNGDLNSVIALLSHGADIKIRNIFNWPPLSAPAVHTMLDHSLQTNRNFPNDEAYEMIFNYRFLLAHVRQENVGQTTSKKDAIPVVKNLDEESFEGKHKVKALTPEMDLLFYLSQSQEYKHLLTHPIITSFLHLKWLRIRSSYFINLVLYILFLVLLNTYIFMDYGLPEPHSTFMNDSMQNTSNGTSRPSSEDKHQETHLERFRTVYGNLIWFSLLFILFCHTVRELFKFVMSPSKYILTLDNILDIALIFITTIVLFKSWEEDNHRKLFTAYSLFLSWIELALIIGRLPKLSINIELMKSVARHYIFIFLSYFLFIIAFAVTFYISYHGNVAYDSENEAFPTLWTAVTHTIMLMTGGLYVPSIKGYGCIIFLLFAFLIIMVMLNVLTGVAVSDVKLIHDNAELLQVVSRIRLLYEIESILIYWNRFMEKICKLNCASKTAAYLNNALRRIILFPNTNTSEKYISVLPNKNATIVFPNGTKSVTCRMKQEILQAAINIIIQQDNFTDLDHMRQSLHHYHKENLQKFPSSSSSFDKIDNTMTENCKNPEMTEENFSMLQNILHRNHKYLDTNMKKLSEQCQLQLTHS